MTQIIFNPRVSLLATVLLTSPLAGLAVAAPFFEDFESGLGQWTGRAGGPSSGQITPDPLASGHGLVLCLTNLTSGGDLFASTAISLPGTVQIDFDYLGQPGLGGAPGDLGGFLGITYSLTATTEGTDLFWYAGTQDSYPRLLVALADDNTWHHYNFQLNASAIPTFHLMLEDYTGSGGVACDVFFDNISVVPVPEPAAAALTLLSLLAGAYSARSPKQQSN